MNTAEAAANTLRELRQKQLRQTARAAEISAERTGLALKSEATPHRTGHADADLIAQAEHGDAKNRVRLLEAEASRLARETELTAEAIKQAKAFLAGPELTAQDLAERRDAQRGHALAEALAKRGPVLQAALETVVREVVTIRKEAQALAGLVKGSPSSELIRVNVERDVVAAMRTTGLDLHAAYAPPSQRRSLADLVESWAARAAQVAQQRLDQPKHKPTKEAA